MGTELAKPKQQETQISVRERMLSAADRVQAAIGKGAGILDARRCLLVAAMHIEENKKLLEVAQTTGGIKSIVSNVAKAALYGWEIGGPTAQAYLVPFSVNLGSRGSPKWEKRAVLIPGYRGLRDLVRRSGECEFVAETVHEGDEFEFVSPFDPPHHKRSTAKDRRNRPITHVYVWAKFGSGQTKTIAWTRDECIAHRDAHSKNWQDAQKYPDSLKSNAWHEENPSFPVMCMKTVIRYAINRGELPVSVQDRRLIEHDDEAELPQPHLAEGDVFDVEIDAETVARIESHGSNETVSEPERPDTLKSGLDIDAFRAELAKCKTPADVRVCCMEAAKTCVNPDEDATVEKEGKMRLDELKGGGK